MGSSGDNFWVWDREWDSVFLAGSGPGLGIVSATITGFGSRDDFERDGVAGTQNWVPRASLSRFVLK